jgi:hypothetical protein
MLVLGPHPVDPGLVTRLVTDAGTGEALPLIAFTLQQLAVDIPRGGQLSMSHYKLLGGVQGAHDLPGRRSGSDRTHRGADPLWPAATGHGRRTRPAHPGPQAPRRSTPAAVRTEPVPFTARRLLTTDTVVIGVTHEASLSSWPPLKAAIAGAAFPARPPRSGTGRHRMGRQQPSTGPAVGRRATRRRVERPGGPPPKGPANHAVGTADGRTRRLGRLRS